MAGYKLPKVTQYVKNVGKSVAYASIDAVKANTNGISEFIDVNGHVFKEVYSSAKNIRATIKNTEKQVKQSNLYKAIDIGVKNLIEDAKSGNFYNDRTSDYSENIIGTDNDDFDMEFSFNDKPSEGNSNKALSDSINNAVGAAAISQNTAIAEGTGLIIRSNSANTKLMMASMEKISANFSSGMGAVYTGVSATNQFLNGPMMAHLENSRRYYEETTKQLRDQSMMLKEMLEMQRNLYKKSAADAKESRLDQSMTGKGGINIAGYAKNVKSNIMDYADSMGLSMMSGGMGNPFMAYAAAPLKFFIQEMISPKLLAPELKKTIRSFDKGITSFFSQLVAKLNTQRDTGFGLGALIGEIFGIKLNKKKNINPGNYEKGAVSFDGVTRQAIIEVIPGYLARIEAALSGAGERHYDHTSGTWKSAKQIQKSYDDEYNRSIANANSAWLDSLAPILEELKKGNEDNKKLYEALKSGSGKMARKIYEDGGDFDPNRGASYYIGNSKADKMTYKEIIKHMSKNDMRSISQDTMQAIQYFASTMSNHEKNGGPWRQLFNGAYDMTGRGNGSKNNYTDFKSNNLLTLATDREGNNIFYYLRNILSEISTRHTSNKKKNKSKGPKTKSKSKSANSNSNSSESESSSDDDPDPDDLEGVFEAYYADKEKKEKEYAKQAGKENIKNRVKSMFGDSNVGKAFGNILGGAASIMATPMQYAEKLLKKADENMFQLMFGSRDYKLRDGTSATNIFQYIVDQIKGTFDELKETIKKSFTNIWENHLKDIIMPKWEKYGKPVVTELKNFGNKAKNRVRKAYNRFTEPMAERSRESSGLNDWYRSRGGEAAANYAEQRNRDTLARGGVVSASDIEQAQQSAFGRVVTKRGLTMISPGEIIIPASFNKREQDKMLALEKRDKRRILNSIQYNARGTVNTQAMKDELRGIYNDNIGKGAKNTAAGIIGAGTGLLTGINPLLGAAAGAGLSILSNSETLQGAIFGKTILEDGTREGGLVSNKIQKYFKKAMPDMGDFGIAGGLLGLFTPFGPLGGAAIGAGIGMLKNSEGFKKFIFGDAETGKDGFIKKETYDKFKAKVKDAAPKMAVGAVGGALLGPFGILGNAAMGAGLGLLTSTDTFHKFIFGYGKDEKPEKGKPRKGLLGAIERGILDPAKEKITEILADFKDFAKKHIFDQMKRFWDPFQQMIKNLVSNVTNGIKDKINDIFEKTIGIPIHDFLQQKIFKPLTKTFFNILKAPINLAKGAIAAPMHLLGFTGDNIRANQIRKGTASNMTAQERLDWMQEHGVRNKMSQIKNLRATKKYGISFEDRDKAIAGMDEETRKTLITQLSGNLNSMEDLQKERGKARKMVGNEISDFFNTKDENGKLRYDKVGLFGTGAGSFGKVKKQLAKWAADGDFDKVEKWIKNSKLSDDEKKQLMNSIKPHMLNAKQANDAMTEARDEDHGQKVQDLLEKTFGKKMNRKGQRSILNLLKSEQANADMLKGDPEEENTEATKSATDALKDAGSKTEELKETIIDTNKYLKDLLNKLKEGNKTTKGYKWDAKAGQYRFNGKFAGKNPFKNEENSATGLLPAHADTISAEDVENATEHARGGFFKKKGLAMVSKGETIMPSFVSKFFKKNVDKDSKEAVEERQAKEREIKAEEEETEETKKTNTILSKMQEKLFGNKKEKGDGESKGLGILGKLGSGFSKFWNFMGVGGKVVLAAGGVSLLGHATQWFKESVWPTIKTALFGKDNADGTHTQGMLGGFGDKLHDLFYGSDGKSGILNKAGTWIGEKLGAIKNWWDSQGGLAGMLQKSLAYMINGWGYAMNNIVTPIVAVIFKHLPGMLLSLGKAILSGLKLALSNKEYSRNTTAKIAGTEAVNDLNSIMSSNNSSLESAMGDFGSSVKTAYNTAAGGMSSTAASAAEVDWSSLYGSGDSGKNNEKASGIGGLLGNTKRTNEIEYDNNGNIITNYAQNNETKSILGQVYDSSKIAFRNGLAGMGGSGAVSKLKNIGTKGTKIGRGKLGFFTKHGTGLIKKTAKGAGATTNTAYNAGAGLNGFVQRLNDDVVASKALSAETGEKASDIMAELGGKAVTNADDVAKNSKSWIGKGADKLKGIFKKGTKEAGETVAETGVKKVTGEVVEESAKQVLKTGLKEGGEEAAKKGMLSGLKGIFSKIATSKIGSKIIGFVAKAGGKIGQNALSSALEGIAEKLGQKALGKLGGAALKKVAGAIANFTPAGIAFMLADFLSGYNNAYTILGIAKTDDGYQVGIGQKIVCGLLNLLNNRFLFGLIPTETIVGIFLDYLAPLIPGLTSEEFDAARSDETINQVLDEWNKEHPEDTVDNLEDYNKKQKWTYKAGKKIKNAFKTAGSWTKDKLSTAGSAIKNGASAALNKTKDIAGAAKNKAVEFASKTKDGITNFVTSTKDKVVNSKTFQFISGEISEFKDNPLDYLKTTVNTVIDSFKSLGGSMLTGAQNLLKSAWAGNTTEAFGTQPADTGNAFVNTVGKVVFNAIKIPTAPIILIGSVIGKIKNAISSFIEGAKIVVPTVGTALGSLIQNSWSGSDEEEVELQSTNNEMLDGISKVVFGVGKVLTFPNRMLGKAVNLVKNGISNIISGAKEGALDASSDIEAVKKGEYTIFSKEYWASDNEDDDNPLSKIGSIAAFITRLSNAPQAMLGYTMTKVKAVFNKIIDGAKDISKDNNKIIEKAKKGDISVFSKDYWKMPEDKDNPLGMVGTIASFIQRLIEAPIVIFTKVFNKIKQKFDDIKGWFSKLFGEDAESVDSGKGKGKGYGKGYRYGFGRYSQLDPSIASMQYNGHTIGEAGCGPVAAANLINNLKGSNVSVQDTVKYATSMGFKSKNDGTDPRYMNSILTASGIPNQNVGKSGIDRSLKQGDPVVIMGKGNNASSPYGNKNPHFITAMGYDNKGNVVVDDPYESGYKTYRKSDVVNGAMKSVAAKRRLGDKPSGYGKRFKNKFGFGRFGFGMNADLKNKIISKTFEITNGAEGNYDSVIANDNGSWSVGIAGFHLPAKIKPLFEDMAAKLSGSAKQQALKFSTWGNKILTNSEVNEVKSFLQANSAVSKEVQDKHLTAVVENNIRTPLAMYDSGILKDYRSIILAADIGNTGPAHLDTWKTAYRPTSSGDELSHVRDSLKSSDSYWGRATGSQYYRGWMNRIDSTYNKLADWSADGYTATIGGSSSENSSGSNTLMSQFSNLGNSMVKAIFGEEAYNAFYGNSGSGNSEGTTGDGGGSISTSEVTKRDGTKVSGPVSNNEHVKKAQISLANVMYSREGQNSYSQNGSLREQQGSGHSDCSSMVSYAYRQTLKDDALTNSVMGSTLPGWSGYTGSQWNKGTLIDTNKNSDKFQVGDLMFWGTGGNTSHVEMYTGNDTIMGHGSGQGPREKKLSTYNHSHPFMGGRRYITEDIAKQAGFGKGGYGKGGVATSALMANSTYSSGSTNVPARSSSITTTNAVDYGTFLQTIVTILMSIADNTAILGKVLDILSDNLGVDINKDEISKATSKTKAQTEKALNDLVQRSTNNTVGVSKLLNNKDTDYIINAMRAIATE